MATDSQSLVTGVAKHNSVAAPRPAQLLRIALLQSIANTLAPSVATDPQSLLNYANVAGYGSVGYCAMADLLELALLQIIAQNIGSGGGGGGVSSGAGAPVNGVTTGTLYFNSTDGSLWASSNNGTTWMELLA